MSNQMLVKLNDPNSTKQIPHSIWYTPDLITRQEILDEAVLIDKPTPLPEVEGKFQQMYINAIEKTAWYEYEDRPLQPADKITLLEQKNVALAASLELLQAAVDELILGGTA